MCLQLLITDKAEGGGPDARRYPNRLRERSINVYRKTYIRLAGRGRP
jgi:hypothetical protein